MTKFDNLPKDTPERRRKRQQRRRDKLHKIAQDNGYESWYRLTTAIINGEVTLTKNPSQ